MRYEHGRILAVNEELPGSELVGNHAAGALTLVVEDLGDFDEVGGQLIVNDAVIEYVGTDEEAGTVTLATALPADAEDGDPVHFWDGQQVVVDLVAYCKVDGADDDEDAIEASISHPLIPLVPQGIREAGPGESVALEIDDAGDWTVVDVLDRSATATLEIENIRCRGTIRTTHTLVNLYSTIKGYVEEYDWGNIFDPATGLVTIPVDGLYAISGGIIFGSNGIQGRRVLQLERGFPDNPGLGIVESRMEVSPLGSNYPGAQVYTEMPLTAGQVLKLTAYQDTGSSINGRGDFGPTYFSVRRISSI